MAQFFIQQAASRNTDDNCARVWYDGDKVTRVEMVHRKDASSYGKRSEARAAIAQFPISQWPTIGTDWIIEIR